MIATSSQPIDMLGSLTSMPALQLFFLLMFFLVPAIGFNMLAASCYRRIGKRRNVFIFPISKFNSREWFIFLALLAITFSFAFLAMSQDCNCA